MKMDDIEKEYDFSGMKSLGKGKYANRYAEGTNLVHLDSDVAKVFHDDKAVNDALRILIKIAKDQIPSA
jgi:hypothetical protein